MKVMVFPRDDQNPYQRMLYGEMERLGTAVSYLGRLTPSHTLNLLLLPLETAVRRAAGARLVHLHWVFGFSLPGSGRFPSLRRLAQAWFVLWLSTTRLLGVHVVWTAHNVLPHARVFADDVAARRALVATSHLVLAHSPSALAGLAALGAVPSRSTVIPHGPLAPVVPCGSIAPPVSGAGPARCCSSGRSSNTKGSTICSPLSRGYRLARLSSWLWPANVTIRPPGPGSARSRRLAASRWCCASSAFLTGMWRRSSNQPMSWPSPIGTSPRAGAPCWHWPTGGP